MQRRSSPRTRSISRSTPVPRSPRFPRSPGSPPRSPFGQRSPSAQRSPFGQRSPSAQRSSSVPRSASMPRSPQAPIQQRRNRRLSSHSNVPQVRRHLQGRQYLGAHWDNGHFVRDRHFGWFPRAPRFFGRTPWFLQWYNARYPWPFLVLYAFAPIAIPRGVDIYNQYALEDYIIRTQEVERGAGRAPTEAHAHLVPIFDNDFYELMWAVPIMEFEVPL